MSGYKNVFARHRGRVVVEAGVARRLLHLVDLIGPVRKIEG